MGEYERRLRINRPAGEVFEFLADAANMLRYLPGLRQVTLTSDHRIRLHSDYGNPCWPAEGWLEVEPGERRLRWGSEAGPECHGEIRVSGDDRQAEVTLRLAPSFCGEATPARTLEETLEAIRQALEPRPLLPWAWPVNRPRRQFAPERHAARVSAGAR